ncbi:MAG: hypothetical protein ABFS22_04515 [Pseudomonadota bacterium]
MNTSELELPKHLYTETADPDGPATMDTIVPDKLIAWSEDSVGDAIDRWCKQICNRKIEVIDAWEDNRILQLEDEWISLEHDGDDDEYDDDQDEDERHYHLACDAVNSNAAVKRDVARERMAEHKTAIEELVQQSREFITAHQPPPQEDHWVGYLLAIAAVAAVAYVLIT